MNLLRTVHRWVGLAIATIVLLVSASGGLLLLREPYYRARFPSLAEPVTVLPRAQAAALSDIEERFGNAGIRLIKFPRPGMNAFSLWFDDGSEALVDPASRAVVARWHWSSDPAAFLFELHAHLLAEEAGTFINGLAALVLVFLGLTGLLLWWPRRGGAFHLRGTIPKMARPAELLRSHAATGAIVALPVMLFAATGAAIVFYDKTAAIMSAWFDSRPPVAPDAHVIPLDSPRRPWPEILAALDRTFPDGETVFFYPGTTANARLMFRKRLPGEWHTNGRSYVVIDPYRAAVVQSIDARAQGPGTRAMHAIYPIHAAKIGGPGMIALAATTALGLSWLAFGGVWVYLAGLKARRARYSYFVKLPHSSISDP
jgi:uncharacterized iron-regulated membrane protein